MEQRPGVAVSVSQQQELSVAKISPLKFLKKYFNEIALAIITSMVTGGFVFILRLHTTVSLLEERDTQKTENAVEMKQTMKEQNENVNRKLDQISEGVQSIDRRLIIVETRQSK
jgi:hypothetical protein